MVTAEKRDIEQAVAQYMALPYRIELIPDPEDGGYAVSVPDLPGCISQGDSVEEAIEMIRDAQRAWLTVALEPRDPIPQPRLLEHYSGRFNVRVPRSLHRALAEAAEAEGVSLNLFVATALAQAANQPAPEKSRLGRPKRE
jgi:antitoxin HicB